MRSVLKDEREGPSGRRGSFRRQAALRTVYRTRGGSLKVREDLVAHRLGRRGGIVSTSIPARLRRPVPDAHGSCQSVPRASGPTHRSLPHGDEYHAFPVDEHAFGHRRYR
jgi:hypothetical protein